MSKIRIFDTTLRDGEQSPGASLGQNEKLQIARQLSILNVDIMEAGFPITSEGDFKSVSNIAKEIRDVSICALARAVDKDIDCAAKALKSAISPRIHVFLATSKIHRKFKLIKAKEEIIKTAVKGIKRARKYVDDVEFSPEDASRTEPDFLVEVVEAVIAAGATTVNIPDTVGYAVPEQYASLIKNLKDNVKNIKKAVISVHCHNDLGLAVANSLAAVKAGATQVECTVNGIGERAGNASLEEIVMTLKTRKDFFGHTTRIRTNEIVATSKIVSGLTGLWVQRNKAIVGENAFAHESGVHQDGVLKESTTYEIMKPEEVGLPRTKIVLGKLSGRHAFKRRVKALGYELPDKELEHTFQQFKLLADKKKEIYDQDIEALIQDEKSETPHIYELDSLSINCGPVPTASVKLRVGKGKILVDSTKGDGPIDAIFKTIDLLTGIKGILLDYSIRSVTSGKDALGEASVEVKVKGKNYRGRAVSTDTIEASAKAYLNAINRVAIKHRKK